MQNSCLQYNDCNTSLSFSWLKYLQPAACGAFRIAFVKVFDVFSLLDSVVIILALKLILLEPCDFLSRASRTVLVHATQGNVSNCPTRVKSRRCYWIRWLDQINDLCWVCQHRPFWNLKVGGDLSATLRLITSEYGKSEALCLIPSSTLISEMDKIDWSWLFWRLYWRIWSNSASIECLKVYLK